MPPRAFGKLAFHLIPYVGPALWAWELYGLMKIIVAGAAVDSRYWDVITCTGGPSTRWENFFRTSCATLLSAGPPAPGNAGSPPDPFPGTGWSTLKLNPNVANRYMSVLRAQRKAGAPSPTPIQAPDTYKFRDPGLLPDPFPAPRPRPSMPQPQPGPGPWPNINPEIVPPAVPGAFPAPLPVNFPRPVWQPAPEPGSEPGAKPKPKPQPFSPSPGVVITPEPAPGHGPTIVIRPVAQPTAGPRPRPSSGSKPGQGKGKPGSLPKGPSHKGKKPGKGKKENKFKGKGAMNAAGKIYGAATEGVDLIDAAWQAAQSNGGTYTKVKGQATTPWQKVNDIYDSFSKPGFNKAGFLADFAKNAAIAQGIDAAIGKASNTKGANTALGKAGMPTGPGNLGIGFGPAL